MRLFYAIMPPPEILRGLTGMQDALRDMGRGRFPRAEKLHVTLRFLGEREEWKLREDGAALARAAQETAPLRMLVEGYGAFGAVAYARVRDDGALAALAGRLGVREKYKPHITLARDYQRSGGGPDAQPIVWHATEIVLLESILGQNARYVVKEKQALRGENREGEGS